MSQPRNAPNNGSTGGRGGKGGAGRGETRPSGKPGRPSLILDNDEDDDYYDDEGPDNDNQAAAADDDDAEDKALTAVAQLSSLTQRGGGFKDGDTARRTLALVAHRSLLYQQQLVQTYLRRARTHSRKATSPGMAEAAAVFQAWLDTTLPALRSRVRGRLHDGDNSGFRPLVPKETARALQPWIDDAYLADLAAAGAPQWWVTAAKRMNKLPTAVRVAAKIIDPFFLNLYVGLEPRAKLGNLVVEAGGSSSRNRSSSSSSATPTVELDDWDTVRYRALDGLVPAGKETMEGWRKEELWEADGLTPTRTHLALLAWAWSPVPTRTLVEKVKKLATEEEKKRAAQQPSK